MEIDLQPTLESPTALLKPLREGDFEALYKTASDPKIWEQHPNKNRWQREVFLNYFKGAMESKGAFLIIDKASGEIAGSTRFCNYYAAEKTIEIGYTFCAVKFWGTGLNPAVKRLMMEYAFQFADKVHFQIGADNLRSQIAIQRLGAQKIGEKTVAYYGEPPKLNFVYEILKP
jgi:N-acetyltransferase